MMMTKTGMIAALAAGCFTLMAGSAFATVAAGSQDLTTKDARITSEVRQKLTRDLPQSNYEVSVATTGDGIVVLSGQADTGLSAAKALRDAQNTPGVTDVQNHLHVVA
ncbi:MAG: BON domain-containing protein [Steroidobacteraceae bacterium]